MLIADQARNLSIGTVETLRS